MNYRKRGKMDESVLTIKGFNVRNFPKGCYYKADQARVLLFLRTALPSLRLLAEGLAMFTSCGCGTQKPFFIYV